MTRRPVRADLAAAAVTLGTVWGIHRYGITLSPFSPALVCRPLPWAGSAAVVALGIIVAYLAVTGICRAGGTR
jgi:hypothetical protein